MTLNSVESVCVDVLPPLLPWLLSLALLSMIVYRFMLRFTRQLTVVFVDHQHDDGPIWKESSMYATDAVSTRSLSDGLLGLQVLGDVCARAAASKRSRRLFGWRTTEYCVVVPNPWPNPVTPGMWNEPLCSVPILSALVHNAKQIGRCLGPNTTVLFVDKDGRGIECDCRSWQLTRVGQYHSLHRRYIDLLVLASGQHIKASVLQRFLKYCSGIGSLLLMHAADQYSYHSDEEYQDAVRNSVLNIDLPITPKQTYFYNSGHQAAVTFSMQSEDNRPAPSLLRNRVQMFQIVSKGYETSAKYFPALLYRQCYAHLRNACFTVNRWTMDHVLRQGTLCSNEVRELTGEFTEFADTISSRHAAIFAYAGALLTWQTSRLHALNTVLEDPAHEKQEEQEEEEEDGAVPRFEHCFKTSRRVSSTAPLNIWDVKLNDGGGQILKEQLFPVLRSH